MNSGSYFLFLLSGIYYLGLNVHRWLSRQKSLDIPVISVGNITVGGSGKTPVVEMICQELLAAGRHPGILSRGYRRRPGPEPLIVSDGKRILTTPEYAGDEPYLLAQHLPGVPVIVGKNRYRSGLLLPALGVDIAVLDDGFQYWGLRRNYDIVCLDATDPFGNGWLLPAGILREPVSSLSRADLIFLNKVNLAEAAKVAWLKDYLARKFPKISVVSGEYRIKVIKGKDGQFSIENFVGRKVVLISGIARPESLEKLLNLNGIEFIKHFRFPDHHDYSERELKAIFRQYPEAVFITTEKDFVRMKTDSEKIFYVQLELIRERKDFLQLLLAE